MGTNRRAGLLALPFAAALLAAGCEALLDDHKKVDIDYCGGYKGDDECCAADDPCDLEDDFACQCNGCGWDQADCTEIWSFADLCDDGYAIDVGVYQVGDDGSFDGAADEPQWEGMTLKELGTVYEFEIDCAPGEYTCWGGWADSGYYWGCGEDCAQYCPDCCYTCDLMGVIVLQLGC